MEQNSLLSSEKISNFTAQGKLLNRLPSAQAEIEEPEKEPQLLFAGGSSRAVLRHRAVPFVVTTPNAVLDRAADDKRSRAATRGNISL